MRTRQWLVWVMTAGLAGCGHGDGGSHGSGGAGGSAGAVSCSSAPDCDSQSNARGQLCKDAVCVPCSDDKQCSKVPYYGPGTACVDGRCASPGSGGEGGAESPDSAGSAGTDAVPGEDAGADSG